MLIKSDPNQPNSFCQLILHKMQQIHTNQNQQQQAQSQAVQQYQQTLLEQALAKWGGNCGLPAPMILSILQHTVFHLEQNMIAQGLLAPNCELERKLSAMSLDSIKSSTTKSKSPIPKRRLKKRADGRWMNQNLRGWRKNAEVLKLAKDYVNLTANCAWSRGRRFTVLVERIEALLNVKNFKYKVKGLVLKLRAKHNMPCMVSYKRSGSTMQTYKEIIQMSKEFASLSITCPVESAPTTSTPSSSSHNKHHHYLAVNGGNKRMEFGTVG